MCVLAFTVRGFTRSGSGRTSNSSPLVSPQVKKKSVVLDDHDGDDEDDDDDDKNDDDCL